jgi:hypothetical protein
MKWQEEDRVFLLSAASEISAYLSSSVLEWRMSPSRLMLTPGRVLLCQKRLSGSSADTEVTDVLQQIDAILHLHQAAWQKKMSSEIPMRLRIWANALREYQEEGLDASYVAQVSHRVMLELLVGSCSMVNPQLLDQLSGLDAALRTLLKQGGFVWAKELEAAFPESDFWFLYCEM